MPPPCQEGFSTKEVEERYFPLTHRLDDNTIALLAKRAYDVAGCAASFKGKPLKVYLNDERLKMSSFVDVSGMCLQ